MIVLSITSIMCNCSDIYEEMPDDYPRILHLFDIWHWIKVSFNFCISNWFILSFKNVMKEVFAAAKLKSCQGNTIFFFCGEKIHFCFIRTGSLGQFYPKSAVVDILLLSW